MRKHYDRQGRFGRTPISELELNYGCRDEIIPVLAGLQYLYTCGELRRKIVQLVAADINDESSRDVGRPGLDDWQIVVFAAIRLACDYDYDKLQDQAENHRSLRVMLGLGEWDDEPSFNARRIRDTLCQLSPKTFEAINHAIVRHGQSLHESADQTVRADSFVVETNIHYPSDSTLIGDGMRKIIPLCIDLAELIGVSGWRQGRHLLRRIKNDVRTIGKICAGENQNAEKLATAYKSLFSRAESVLNRAKDLQKQANTDNAPSHVASKAASLQHWITLTIQVCDVAYRRVVLGEKVPKDEKLFSLFETHTQLYRRGKARTPSQFGRQVLIFEDGAGFISHYDLMDRELTDSDVIIEQMRHAQKKHNGNICSASVDRGFYSEDNEKQLKEIIDEPCVPPSHTNQYAQWLKSVPLKFRQARQWHSGVESTIGALQSGNGLKRCRDRSELGFERYVGLAILGRNIHTLGRLLIASRDSKAVAAQSKRKAA